MKNLLIFYLIILSALNLVAHHSVSLANDKKVFINAKLGSRYVIDKSNDQLSFKGEKLVLGGSIHYGFQKHNSIGLAFDYWDDVVGISGVLYTTNLTKLKVYKVALEYKRDIMGFSNNMSQWRFGGSLGYYYASLNDQDAITGERIRKLAKYRDLGLGILTELKINFILIWTELSIIRFHSGEKINNNDSVWQNMNVPRFSFHNLSGGIGLNLQI